MNKYLLAITLIYSLTVPISAQDKIEKDPAKLITGSIRPSEAHLIDSISHEADIQLPAQEPTTFGSVNWDKIKQVKNYVEEKLGLLGQTFNNEQWNDKVEKICTDLSIAYGSLHVIAGKQLYNTDGRTKECYRQLKNAAHRLMSKENPYNKFRPFEKEIAEQVASLEITKDAACNERTYWDQMAHELHGKLPSKSFRTLTTQLRVMSRNQVEDLSEHDKTVYRSLVKACKRVYIVNRNSAQQTSSSELKPIDSMVFDEQAISQQKERKEEMQGGDIDEEMFDFGEEERFDFGFDAQSPDIIPPSPRSHQHLDFGEEERFDFGFDVQSPDIIPPSLGSHHLLSLPLPVFPKQHEHGTKRPKPDEECALSGRSVMHVPEHLAKKQRTLSSINARQD